MQHCSHWIGGKPVEGTGAPSDIFNPATGERSGQAAMATEAEVDAAVRAGAEAFPEWRDTSLTKRTQVLFSFRELVRVHAEELAELISAEHGKLHQDALGEVARGLEVVEFACGIAHLLKGSYSENVSTRVDTYSIRQPLGVVAGITPFNFPVMVPMWMFPLAIACGNSFVLKPSEKDPSPSLLLARLWQEAGLPDGVFNVIQGDKTAVDRLLGHPEIKAVSFVGSTPIARYVYETGTRHGKRVQALGGAKNHMLVLPDADLDMAADAAVSAGFGSAGERCMAISVVLAVEPVGDALVAKIRERVEHLRVGPATAEESEMGPLISRAHRDRVRDYIDKAAIEGATVVVDGRKTAMSSGGARTSGNSGASQGQRDHGEEIKQASGDSTASNSSANGDSNGFWLGPSVIDHVGTGTSLHTDEIFGPVLSIVRVPSYAAALEIINSGAYGNGTAIFTRDGGAARRFQTEVEVGMVGINVPIPVPVAYYSFGGWKTSLFGDTHVYGMDGIHFYTRGKVVTSRWHDPSQGGVNLGFPVNL